MRLYGKYKTPSKVTGHQDCAICHPETKEGRARARREGKEEIEKQLAEWRDAWPLCFCPFCYPSYRENNEEAEQTKEE